MKSIVMKVNQVDLASAVRIHDRARKESRNYYQLKGNLTEIQLEKGSARLVLVFEKRSDPEYSAERLKEMQGSVVVAFKKRRARDDLGRIQKPRQRPGSPMSP